jgi:hypothetical protein
LTQIERSYDRAGRNKHTCKEHIFAELSLLSTYLQLLGNAGTHMPRSFVPPPMANVGASFQSINVPLASPVNQSALNAAYSSTNGGGVVHALPRPAKDGASRMMKQHSPTQPVDGSVSPTCLRRRSKDGEGPIKMSVLI